MADVAEEVARFYGYDKIPTTLPSGEATTGKMPFKLRIENIARDIAEYCGFSEGMTYSFESPKVFDKLRIPEDNVLRRDHHQQSSWRGLQHYADQYTEWNAFFPGN